jgi:uncharacterized protein YggE
LDDSSFHDDNLFSYIYLFYFKTFCRALQAKLVSPAKLEGCKADICVIINKKGDVFMHLPKKIFLALCLGVLCLVVPGLAAAEERDSITVTGAAVTEVEPDMAYVYLDLMKEAPTAEEAREGVATKLQSLKTVLLGSAVTSENAKSTGYNLEPVYTYNDGKRKQNGFRASTTMKVKVVDLEKLGGLLDNSVNKAGASVSRVEFGLNNKNIVEQRLLTEAVTNARSKAELVATAGGRSLGVMIQANISSSGGENHVVMNSPMLMAKMDRAEGATPTELNPGTITVRSSVNLVFALRPVA